MTQQLILWLLIELYALTLIYIYLGVHNVCIFIQSLLVLDRKVF